MLKKPFFIVCSSIFMMAAFTFAESVTPSTNCEKPESLTSVEGVYKIASCGDLYKFAEMVNSGNVSINGKLTADIVVNENVLKADGSLNGDGKNFIQWTPIGDQPEDEKVQKSYVGTFDGAGHTISGLFFNDESRNNAGLFGFLDSTGVLQNVALKDSYILGKNLVGGLAGQNWGTIRNCYTAATVKGEKFVGGVVGFIYSGNKASLVSNSYNAGSVIGQDSVGGVAGLVWKDFSQDAKIENSYSTGSVRGTGKFVGGVVGDNVNGTVKNSYFNKDFFSGNAIGKIQEEEESDGLSTEDFANLDVKKAFPVADNAENPWTAGGMEGSLYKLPYITALGESAQPRLKRELEVIFYDVDGVNQLGNFWPIIEGQRITAGMLPSKSNFVVAGWYRHDDKGFTEWNFEEDVVTDDLALYIKGVGRNDDGIFEIANATDIENFALLVNKGITDDGAVLTADICLNACNEGESVLNADGTLNGDGKNFTQWTPIGRESFGSHEGSYKGTFDGAGHTISGLYVVSNDYAGLFCRTEGATVKNVHIKDSYVRSEKCAGGIVGNAYLSVISNSSNAGSVVSKSCAGGLLGYSDKTSIDNSYNSGFVSGIGGNIGNGDYRGIGGLVGFNNNNGSVSYAYNTGSVTGESYVGSVVGQRGEASFTNVYYNSEVCEYKGVGGETESADVEGSIAKTSQELLAGKNLGFNAKVWVVGGVGENAKQDTLFYPYLKNLGATVYKLDTVKKYTISVLVNDDAMGSVSGAGTFAYGTEIDVEATANMGYQFKDWQDAVKDAKRTIKVTADTTLTANFEVAPSCSSEEPESSSSSVVPSSDSESSSSEVEISSSVMPGSFSEEPESSSRSAKSSSSSAKAKSSSSSAKAKSSSSKGKDAIAAAAQIQQFSVAVSGNVVSIAGIRPNTTLSVFDMQGNKVKVVFATSENFSFALPNFGTYIVKSGYTVKLVKVR